MAIFERDYPYHTSPENHALLWPSQGTVNIKRRSSEAKGDTILVQTTNSLFAVRVVDDNVTPHVISVKRVRYMPKRRA